MTTTRDVRGTDAPRPTFLRIAAALTALAALVQLVLGLIQAFGDPSHTVVESHEHTALALLVLSALAALAAWLWRARSGNTGLAMHATTVLVLAVVQYGLGEAMHGSDGLRWAHILIGLAFSLAAFALASLAFRKPFPGRAV